VSVLVVLIVCGKSVLPSVMKVCLSAERKIKTKNKTIAVTGCGDQ
jgi:hypothetical protein